MYDSNHSTFSRLHRTEMPRPWAGCIFRRVMFAPVPPFACSSFQLFSFFPTTKRIHSNVAKESGVAVWSNSRVTHAMWIDATNHGDLTFTWIRYNVPPEAAVFTYTGKILKTSARRQCRQRITRNQSRGTRPRMSVFQKPIIFAHRWSTAAILLIRVRLH